MELASVKNALPLKVAAKVVQPERWWLKADPDGIFFMVGRSKSDPGTDFSAKEVAQAILLAGDLEAANRHEIEVAIEAGYIKEICNDC